MDRFRDVIAGLKQTIGATADCMGKACAGFKARRSRPAALTFTSVKWLSSRRIRQQYFTDQFESSPGLFDQAFADAIDKKRGEAEKQFLKVALVQITITSFMLLALMKASVTFSILGVSSADAYKLRDFLLFCQAATVSWSVILQQYHHKLEDIIVAWVKHNTASEEALPPILLRYLGPLEAFNINVLPYKQNQFHNLATRNIFRIHGVLRLLSALAFASFTLVTPLIVAISVYRVPSNGWFSYTAVLYWTVVMLFAITSSAINVFGIPYTDYSYAMKLDALQRSDPNSHRRIMADIVRTGKRVDF
jgi:hypothetical protein